MNRFTQIAPSLLEPRIAELGLIKIGGRLKRMKGSKGAPDWFVPKKFDHFVITTRERGPDDDKVATQLGDYVVDDALMTEIKKKAGNRPRELDVHLMYDLPEHNFQYFLAAYDGKRSRCQGNGVEAHDREDGTIPCPCPLLKQFQGEYPKERPGGITCKPFGRLKVILDVAQTFGGFHVFRTTSWQTISQLAGALRLFHDEFGGLRGLPLKLVMFATTDTYEQGGRTRTSRSYKITLVLRANQDTAYRIAAQAREWRREFLLPPAAAAAAAEETTAIAAATEEKEAEVIAKEFHDDGEAEEGDGFYEIDDEHPLEPICRRAMEIANVEATKINQALLTYADRMTELASEIEEKRPEAWKQAMAEAELEAEEEAAREEATAEEAPEPEAAPAAKPMLDLFGDG